MISTFDRFRFARRCAIPAFVSLGPKNHNMHHRTSTDFDLPAMCDICFVSIGPKNHNMHHRTSTDFDLPVDVRYLFCIYWLEKITTCIIAHRPISICQSMCDIGLCLLARKITRILAHRPISIRPSMRDIGLCLLARKITRILAHRPISIRPSMCDIGFVSLGPKKSQHASSHIDRFRFARRCAISPALWRTKKSHGHPSDEVSMKNVDNDAANIEIGLICYLDA